MSLETIDPDEARPSDLVGSSIQRREDPRLITGEAEYTDDIHHPEAVHLAIKGSQYGHAEIESIDTSDAAELDGVTAAYTAAELDESGVSSALQSPASDANVPEYPLLATDAVRFQGQPVAAVIAEDRYTAREALSEIDISYNRQEAVSDPRTALEEEESPTIHEEAPDNVAFRWENGDAEATDEAFERADHTVSFDPVINRVIPTAMEPRTAFAQYEKSTDELTVELSTQNPHSVRSDLSQTLDLAEEQIRVRSPDVGGGFGAKLPPYTGHLLASWCAIQLERPVKWVATRTEDCQSMVHSRYQDIEAEAALSEDGHLLGVRMDSIADVGGYLVPGGSIVPKNIGLMLSGQYALPAAHVELTGVFTTTAPLAAYRGAGRPEATYFIERLVEVASRELDMDPVTFRRQNFIPTDEFPYETGFGHTYDSGDYEQSLEKALSLIDYDHRRERQAELSEDGRYLGIGISCYVEACGVGPNMGESGIINVKPSGDVVVKTGTTEIGTGHRTGYTQIVASALGVPHDDIEIIEGDTDAVHEGHGTAGSRAMPVGGSAIRETADAVIEKGRQIAARSLEAAPDDIAFADGAFSVRGAPDRSLTLVDVAAMIDDDPSDADEGLEATSNYEPPNYTYPFGTHAAVVEVTPETGDVEIEQYVAVDDVGTQINPKLVEGQIHGGVVQGIGQALYEEAIYDSNGNLLTGSLQDYAVPKAEHVPSMETATTVTECPHNPLGVKGVGEAGAIAAPPAIVNAVVDALSPFEIDHLDMPLTNETVWEAVCQSNN
ncbi:xanthine dehydrogenase family protein molybdopterin-binding subunit [Halocatena marina]|uniref:Xanthine dehydrogenase family protein molybdopterin-binding subunit n=1 Tax=Halocatena marina TaxID=2934937 RepID=A0ABD5YJX1_9EURY|nr:xanthine dehydrogenase family protein molybdopterin-binding subunit [Halocatena marina]